MGKEVIKTILVDDEEKSLQNLKKLLEIYCKQVQVIGEAYDIATADKLIQTKGPDLVFFRYRNDRWKWL